MLILLPCFVFLLLYLIVFNHLSKTESAADALRSAIVYTAGSISLFIIFWFEILGSFSAITNVALIILWSICLLGLLWLVWRNNLLAGTYPKLAKWWKSVNLGKFDKLILGFVGLYLVVTFLIAVISPPNNMDSLQYHLTRVIHWIQNGSFRYYPVAYLSQLFYPIGAEALLLNTFMLSGGDALLNLQQWFFMFFSLLLVSLIARNLGAGNQGAWMGVACLISLPAGILEATSTQNDYVTTFWVLALVFLVMKIRAQGAAWIEVIFTGIIVALATITKVGSYPFVAVLLIWLAVILLRNRKIKQALAYGLVIGAIALSINIPGWYRSFEAFSHPFGETSYINEHINKVKTPGDLVISPIQHLALNLGTPFTGVNESIETGIIDLCGMLKASDCSVAAPGEWGFRMIGLSNHEDSAGNPLHLFIFIIAIFLFLLKKKDYSNRTIASHYLLVVILSFLLFCWVISVTTFMGRLQLPFFAMTAPFIGLVLEKNGKGLVRFVMILVLVCGLPWLLFNRTRPIIGLTPDVTLVKSVFVETRSTLLFANFPEVEEEIRHVTSETLKSGCKNISLKIDSRDPEYFFMAYLQPWRNHLQIESVAGNRLLDQYKNPDFKACAQICSICGFDPNPDGLIFAYKDKAMTLYLSPEYYAAYINK
jgi:hypothetical protein